MSTFIFIKDKHLFKKILTHKRRLRGKRQWWLTFQVPPVNYFYIILNWVKSFGRLFFLHDRACVELKDIFTRSYGNGANTITIFQVLTLLLLCTEPTNWTLATLLHENKLEMTFYSSRYICASWYSEERAFNFYLLL